MFHSLREHEFPNDWPHRPFNSILDHQDRQRDATLTLILRACAFQVPGGRTIKDVADSEFPTRPWTVNEFRGYLFFVQEWARRRWDDQFWLETPANCDLFQPTAGRTLESRIDVLCRLRLEILPQAQWQQAHAILLVANVRPRGNEFRDYVRSWVRRDPFAVAWPRLWEEFRDVLPRNISFRDKSVGVFNRDNIYPRQGRVNVGPRVVGDEDGFRLRSQIPVLHEIGHLLGLRHVLESSPACGDAPPNHACRYGRSTPQYPLMQTVAVPASNDEMGLGSDRNLWHARPWQRAMLQYWAGGRWQAHRRVSDRRIPVR